MFSNIYPARLTEWQNKGYIKKITNNFYIISDLEINENSMFLIANKIYEPAYISVETALSYYGIIPEQVFSIVSLTTNRSKTFDTPLGKFFYKTIPFDLFFGYETIKYKDFNFKIADKEKAILDYMYLHRHLKTIVDFESVRFNISDLKSSINKDKILFYLSKYRSKAFVKTINKLLKYIYHA